MKTCFLANLALGCLALNLAAGGQTARSGEARPNTELEKLGYALGMDLGSSLKQRNFPADADFLGRGVKDVLQGAPSLLTQEEAGAVLKSLPAGPTNLPANDKNFKSVPQEVGYAFGMYVGKNLKATGTEPDVANLVKAIKDVLAGSPTLLTTEEERAILTAFGAKAQAAQAAANLKAGRDFLDKNKGQPGVTELAGGLQYSVMTAGKGPIPKPTDTVQVNYRGTFLDGSQFDASPPGKPFACHLTGGVIQGWLDILKLMPVGSKWKVFIPPDLAYGPSGRPGIPPNATLVFEMELLSIEAPAAPR